MLILGKAADECVSPTELTQAICAALSEAVNRGFRSGWRHCIPAAGYDVMHLRRIGMTPQRHSPRQGQFSKLSGWEAVFGGLRF